MTARALVLGVPTTSVPFFPYLAGARNDATRFGRLLSERGFEEVQVFAEGLTVQGFKEKLLDLRDRTRAHDLSVIYVSGHGSEVADSNGDEPWDEALVLMDGRLTDDWFGDEFWPKVQPDSAWVTCADTCHGATIIDRDELLEGDVALAGGDERSAGMQHANRRPATLVLPAATDDHEPVVCEPMPLAAEAARIILAASADDEDAKEIVVEGKRVSWYTHQLAELLTSNAELTYKQLWNRLYDRWLHDRHSYPGLGKPQVSLTDAANEMAGGRALAYPLRV